jgi:hypothetical protein
VYGQGQANLNLMVLAREANAGEAMAEEVRRTDFD